MAKLTNLIKKSGKLSFSYEVTPDLPICEVDNLIVEPLFYSVTWHAKAHMNEGLDIAPLRLAKQLRAKDKEVMLHLSCDLLRKKFLNQILTVLQQIEIRNLFIILGERYDPTSSDFKTTEDLIKYTRKETGDYFCIGVAGSPDCPDDKLQQLKLKVDSGADFVLTQAFFDYKLYSTFTSRCKAAEINVPVIPGVFPFETYQQLSGFINMCKIKVSDDILNYVKDKGESDNLPGKGLTQLLVKSIAAESDMLHFHLFTMNKLKNLITTIQPLLN